MKQFTRKANESAAFEVLEARQLMSVSPTGSASVSHGTLTLTGDAKLASRITVDYGVDAKHISVNVNNWWETFSTSGLKQIKVSAGTGNDYVYENPNLTIPMNVQLGNGNNTVRTGAGNDTIVVGNGDDLIFGKAGNNQITAGNGNDTLMGDRGNDTLSAGNGNDDLIAGGGINSLNVGNGADFIELSSRNDIATGDGHTVSLSGLKNGYLYTKNGAATAAPKSVIVTNKSTGTGTNTGTGTVSGAGGTIGKSGGSGSTGTSSGTSNGTSTTGGGSSTKSTGTGTTGSGSNSNTSSTQTSGGTSGKTGGNSGATGGTSGTSGTTGGTSGATGGGSSTKTTSTGSTASGTGSNNSSTKTTTGTSSGTTGTVTTSKNADAPVPVIKTLAGPRFTGLVVNVDALSTTLTEGTDIQAQYDWNFGDPGSVSNGLTGFDSAHIYQQPGKYSITLTVTNVDGISATATESVTIAANTRNVIYVDASAGSDSNTGTESAPLKTVQAAINNLQNNSEVLLKAGQTFDVTGTLHVFQTNVVISRYGTGADPMLNRISGNGTSTIATSGYTNGFTIDHIQFNSPYGVAQDALAGKTGVSGLYLAGSNIAVTNCTFLNVDDAVNEIGFPTGVLVQGNSAPLDNGLRGYFVWGQGTEQTIDSNYAANSTREHILRLVDLTEVAIDNNNFTNLTRSSKDQYDRSKGCIEVHRGSYEWIANNTVTDGDIRIGPLGLWGEPATSSTENAVIQDNQLTDTYVYVMAGAHNAMIEGNVIDNTTGQAIVIAAPDGAGRVSNNITIQNNTAVTGGTSGNFLMVDGWAYGVTLKDNLWVAPNIQLGSNSTAPVYVDFANLGGFTSIGGNVWPAPKSTGTWAQGGINFVGTSWVSSGYQTPQQWDAMAAVQQDTFENVELGASYQITVASQVAGAPLKMAA